MRRAGLASGARNALIAGRSAGDAAIQGENSGDSHEQISSSRSSPWGRVSCAWISGMPRRRPGSPARRPTMLRRRAIAGAPRGCVYLLRRQRDAARCVT
jgi:hypothetical protein